MPPLLLICSTPNISPRCCCVPTAAPGPVSGRIALSLMGPASFAQAPRGSVDARPPASIEMSTSRRPSDAPRAERPAIAFVFRDIVSSALMLLALGLPEFCQKPMNLAGHGLWRMDRHEMSGLDDPKSCR